MLRCIPPDRGVDATLATWPNVLALIRADLDGPPYPGREQAPLDPDQVFREGGDGHCIHVPVLAPRRASEPAAR